MVDFVFVDLYCRVSTAEQANEGYSIGEQEKKLRRFAEAHDWKINAICVDGGYSGAKLDRPGIQNVIADCNAKRIQKVVVLKLDRLSRSQKDTLYLIEDVFLKNGVDFVSMTESLDTSTPFGMAMIGILSVFAQLEREQIRERLMMGSQAAIREGHYKGGGMVPIGYDRTEDGLVINEYEAAIIRRVYDMYNSGETANKIAVILENELKLRDGVWNAQRVKRLLTQPLFVGKQRYHDEILDCVAPPIVSQETWDACQAEITRRNLKLQYTQSPYKHNTLLGGLLWCGKCGARYSGRSCGHKINEPSKRYYTCYGRYNEHNNKSMRKQEEKCLNKNWRISQLDYIVLEEINKLASDPSSIESKNPKAKEDDEKYKKGMLKRVEEIDRQVARLVDLYTAGRIDMEQLDSKAERLQLEKENLQNQVVVIEEKKGSIDYSDAVSLLKIFQETACSSPPPHLDLYHIVHQLIKSIRLTDEQIEIEWNFE